MARYRFDIRKIDPGRGCALIEAAQGQLGYEWRHLPGKLHGRSPSLFAQWRNSRVR